MFWKYIYIAGGVDQSGSTGMEGILQFIRFKNVSNDKLLLMIITVLSEVGVL